MFSKTRAFLGVCHRVPEKVSSQEQGLGKGVGGTQGDIDHMARGIDSLGVPKSSENGTKFTGLSHVGRPMSREACDHLQKEERKPEPLARPWPSMSLIGLSMSRG